MSLQRISVQRMLVATKPLSRSVHRSQPLCEDARLAELKKWQKHFQTPDGVPVYLKRGVTDRLLLGFIVIGTTLGFGNSMKFLYDELIKP